MQQKTGELLKPFCCVQTKKKVFFSHSFLFLLLSFWVEPTISASLFEHTGKSSLLFFTSGLLACKGAELVWHIFPTLVFDCCNHYNEPDSLPGSWFANIRCNLCRSPREIKSKLVFKMKVTKGRLA